MNKVTDKIWIGGSDSDVMLLPEKENYYLSPKVTFTRERFSAVLSNDNSGEAASVSLGLRHEQRVMDQLFGMVDLEGGSVIDGGAGYGGSALEFCREVGPSGIVYSIEIQRIIFQALCANLFLNGIHNVCAIHGALAESSLGYCGWSNGFSYFSTSSIDSGGVRTEPELGSIRHFDASPKIAIDDLDASDVRLIKLDLEGSELDAIKGAQKTIKKFRPHIFCEISEIYVSRLGMTMESTIKEIENFGYSHIKATDTESYCEVIFSPLP